MNFLTKVAVSAITIGFTVFAGIWGGFEKIDSRMDEKVAGGKQEVLTIIYQLKDERNALLKAQDDKFAVQMVAVNTNMVELKKDVRAILGIARKSQVFIDKSGKTYYTIIEQGTKGNHL